MKTLAALQENFHAHLLNMPTLIAQGIVNSGRIDVEHRLHIYHNAYRARLLEALQDTFEKTWAYLGDEVFDSAASGFIETHPSPHRNIRWYGEEFPQWLASVFPNDRDIEELAIIDWQLRRAFDAPDAPPLRASDLAHLSAENWESVGFSFTKSLFIASIQYNSVPIWHAIDRNEEPPPAEILADKAWLMIWRKGWQPHFRTIQASERGALFQLTKGDSFSQTCATLSELFPDEDPAVHAAEMLSTWLRDEILVKLTLQKKIKE